VSSVAKTSLTPDQYLARERGAEFKCEYFRGEIFAMAGASARHNLIVLNTGAVLRDQLRDRPCRVYPSDLRLEIRATGLITYPDVSVVCGEPEFAYDRGDVLLNPIAIVEVLSDSTEAYDRGKKFEHYRQIPTLKHYVMISQDRASVEVFTLHDRDDWTLRDSQSLSEALPLSAIECQLPLAEVYAKVQFGPATAPTEPSP
jgi:Uma2 family endonuclease